MPIQVTCNSCGKSLKAKDSAAGKRVKCPQCGDPITIPEAVYDAQEAGGDEDSDSEYDDAEYGYEDDQYNLGDEVANAPTSEKRKPCPACGEMIVDGAVKCRFCGEIFDASLKKKARKKGGGGTDDEMTTGDWVVAVLCSGIGCIAGIIWMIQGKPKGSKMFGVSLLMQFFWGAVRVIIEMAAEGMR